MRPTRCWAPRGPPRTTRTFRELLNAGFQRDRPAIGVSGRCRSRLNSTRSRWRRSPVSAPYRTPSPTARSTSLSVVAPARRWRRSGCAATARTWHKLRDRIDTWARATIKELTDAVPAMPVEDRAADAWEPMLAVADAAGGDWPKLARAACRVLSESADDADEDLGAITAARHPADLRRRRESFLPSKVWSASCATDRGIPVG